MRRWFPVLALAILALSGLARAQQADHVVISELRFYEVSGVNEEFVELYNPTDTPVDLGGWRIQYKSATGTTWTDKQVFPAGELLIPHRFLLFGGTAVTPAPDYPSVVAVGLGNSGGHVRLVNGALATIDRVAWLTGDTPEGTAIPTAHPRGASYERKAFEESTEADMAPGGLHDVDGNGWDANDNNADFVIHQSAATCSPQNRSSSPEPDVPMTDGSGTATCSLSMIDNPDPVDFTVTITAEDYLLSTIQLVLPEGWVAAGVALEGAGFSGAVLSQDGNTYTASAAAVAGDTEGIFSLSGVTHPMATGEYTLLVRTAVTEGTPLQIGSSPVITVIGDPIEIAELHVNGPDGLPLLLGQTVVIRGVVTADEQQGVAVYLQDATGGAVGYSAGFSAAVNVGDDVTVMGTVTHFNGLMELTPADLMSVNDTGVPVEAQVVTCAQIAAQGAAGEPYEGLLVRVNGVTIEGSGSWAGNTNYNFSDATGSGQLRISSTSELVGTPIPTGAVDMLGVMGQYDVSAPYHSGYQLLPRFTTDQIQLVGPGLTGGPYESEHTTTSVRLDWTTANPGSTLVVWGHADGSQIDSLAVEEAVTEHSTSLQDLEPGTPYWVRVGSANQSGAGMTGTSWVSTLSLEPGSVEVLFTHDAETDYALPGNEAQDNQEGQIVARLNSYIDNATTSIDCAVYSLNIASVATALIDAHDRGVAVRFIYDADHSQPEVQQLVNAGITVIDNSYGQHPGAGIQHNKFLVFDAADGDASNDVVWTGSVNLIDNPSDNGIHAKDNAIIITDQAVARAYTLEFNEMWGGAGMAPDPAQSRFGEYKTNNTPHYFTVDGSPVEIWFSHGDNVSQRIVNYLATADHAVYFCIFSFSRNEIGYGMRDAHERGAAVRGVFDSQGDEFSEWLTLLGWGADIHLTDGGAVLHHKYMVLDAELSDSDPTVIAGSYNWSNSAEDSNNENTVVLHDALLVNQYLQEFAARYHQAGGQADFDDVAAPGARPRSLAITALYPNPFNPTTQLELALPQAGEVRLAAYDLAGRRVWSRDLGLRPAGTLRERLDFSGQASGLYLLRAESPAGAATTKLLLVR